MLASEEVQPATETTVQATLKQQEANSNGIVVGADADDVKLELNGNVYEYGSALYHPSSMAGAAHSGDGDDVRYESLHDERHAFTNPLYAAAAGVAASQGHVDVTGVSSRDDATAHHVSES